MATAKTIKTKGNPDLYVEEFLFRGRRDGDDRSTGWHVVFGLQGLDPLGRAYPHIGPLNADQVAERGWDIPELMADINGQVMEDLEAERVKVRELGEQLEHTAGKLASATDTNTALQGQMQNAVAEITKLKADLAAATEAAQPMSHEEAAVTMYGNEPVQS